MAVGFEWPEAHLCHGQFSVPSVGSERDRVRDSKRDNLHLPLWSQKVRTHSLCRPVIVLRPILVLVTIGTTSISSTTITSSNTTSSTSTTSTTFIQGSENTATAPAPAPATATAAAAAANACEAVALVVAAAVDLMACRYV